MEGGLITRQVRRDRWRVATLMIGASALTLGVATSPAAAQDQATTTSDGTAAQVAQGNSQAAANSPNVDQDIIVTGIRGSLQRDLDIKRDASGIVDAISTEDIGKFPDNNLASAMQRIPGVSISRGAASLGGTPTTTGQASEITVRGFGPAFNETLYDGRVVSSSTGNRGFDFSSVGADFVGEVDILKTPDASLSSGAIGATINIKYPKPFDHPGMRVVGSLSGNYLPDDGHVTPNVGGLFSDTFANDTIGILVDAAYSHTKVQQNHVNIQGWAGFDLDPSQLAGGANGQTQPIPAWFIQDYGIYKEYTDDQRVGGRAVLQWHPSDSLMITLNDDYSRDKVSANQYGYSIWFNSGSLTNVQLDNNGTITNFNQPNTPTDFQSQINAKYVVNNEYGLNAKWDATDRLRIEFDADRAQSWLNPDGQIGTLDADVGYGSCASGTCLNENNVGIKVGGKNSLPYPTEYGPGGDTSRFTDGTIIGSHVMPIYSPQNKDTVNQAKLQATWKGDTTTIRLGAQYVEDHERLREYDTQQNTNWQAYSGYGPASGSSTGVAVPADILEGAFGTNNFIPGFSGNGNLPNGILKFNAVAEEQYLESLGNPQEKNIPGFNYGGAGDYNGIFRLEENTGAHQDITEKTWAGYISFQQKTQLGSMPFVLNAGVREEITQTISVGLGKNPTGLAIQPGDLTALSVAFGPASTIRNTHTYSYLLPSLDANLDLTDRLKLRFDASRTLTRPPLNELSPVLNVPATVRVNALTATGNNPNLLPYVSDNLDLGLEWYYRPNSYLSIDGFVKKVRNFPVQGSTVENINGVTDPSNGGALAQFTVSSVVNGPSAVVRGLEVAWQNTFGNSGFGFQVNGTLVGTNKPYDPYNTSVSGFAVTGLANSANFVGFYDKHGFQARIAVNWRGEYLDHFGQYQNTSKLGTEPTFVNANTDVDFSTSYDINKHFDVYLEALNLTNATYSTHGRFDNQLLDAVSYGRTFTLGAHVRF